MRPEEIAKDILLCHYQTRRALTSTFLRFQEHYESPEFRGKVFSLDEYKRWYIANSPEGKISGTFTYYTDWSGFNIPGRILEPFYQGTFDPLSLKEERFLGHFVSRRSTPFYVIGTYGTEKPIGTLEHEIAHGLFETNPEYKRRVLSVLNTVPQATRETINSFFASLAGYHPDVFEDETHAFLLTGFERLKKHGLVSDEHLPIQQNLRDVFVAFR